MIRLLLSFLRFVRFVALLAAALACAGPTPQELADGDDPLAALRSPARSARYDGSFWAREAEGKTRLFELAVAYCGEPGNAILPNCETVGLVLSTLELQKAAEDARAKLEALLAEGERILQSPPPLPVPRRPGTRLYP